MLGNKKDLLFRTNQNINGKSIEIRKYSERTEIYVINPLDPGHKILKSFDHFENLTEENCVQLLSADQQVLEFINKEHPSFNTVNPE
jgi:hypothetical protein